MNPLHTVFLSRMNILLRVAQKTCKIYLGDVRRLIGADIANHVNLDVVTRWLYEKGVEILYGPGEMGPEEIVESLAVYKRKQGYITEEQLSKLLANQHLGPIMDKIHATLHKLNLEIVDNDHVEKVLAPKGIPYDAIVQRLVELKLSAGRLELAEIETMIESYAGIPFKLEKILYMLSEYGIRPYSPEEERKKQAKLDFFFAKVQGQEYVIEGYLDAFLAQNGGFHRDEVMVHLMERGIEVISNQEYDRRRELAMRKILVKTRAYFEEFGFFNDKFALSAGELFNRWNIRMEDFHDFCKLQGLDPAKHPKPQFLRKTA